MIDINEVIEYLEKSLIEYKEIGRKYKIEAKYFDYEMAINDLKFLKKIKNIKDGSE